MLMISKQLEQNPFFYVSAGHCPSSETQGLSLARSWKLSLQFFPTWLTARGSPNMVTAIEYK